MSGARTGPATAPERLTELAELLDDEVTRATFGRGLAIGALVGAAVAGTLLRRRRRRRRRAREVARIEPPLTGRAPTDPPRSAGS